jgi:adenylosuccinate synthase
MPYHVWQDGYEEERLGDKKFGSTKRGIAYVYGDKYMKTCIRIGDLLDEEYMAQRLADVIQLKSITLQKVYGKDEINYEEMLAWLKKYAAIFKDYIVDTGVYLRDAVKAGKRIMFEAQLGALRDIDFGIYPYTSSSSVIAAYAPIGAGIPGEKIDASIGIMKAYSTCVGEGPFTAELGMTEEEKDDLRKAGGEYGAATGRPRRVGPFDVVASKYGCRVQGASEIALTKLDILSSMKKIPVVTAYDVDGTLVYDFPTGDALNRAKPVVEYLEGWNCDVSGCRKVEDLPKAALDYIRYIEKAVDCKITYVSVGAEREAYVKM